MHSFLNLLSAIHPIPGEVIGGLLFIVSFAGFPGSSACLVLGFRNRSRFSSYALFAIGGALLTQLRWYFAFMGASLGDKMGNGAYPVWGRFAFFGFGVGAVVLVVSEVHRACRSHKT
ncbi:MAG: hypothetical protein CFE32_18935 [Alphaproteobacteria bacterium PA3]|nr:MAG: hypothetical protein CFE32_18935 [Alphaproteobacteria bacterium PA3]